jgi:hypothetical protein
MGIDSITVVAGQTAQCTVVNAGEISMEITLVPSDSLDAVIALVLLDQNGMPLLDENNQYILGG